ncbi:hypothetical protein MTO96_013885 [Rhipicephalus appendiculatus]
MSRRKQAKPRALKPDEDPGESEATEEHRCQAMQVDSRSDEADHSPEENSSYAPGGSPLDGNKVKRTDSSAGDSRQ